MTCKGWSDGSSKLAEFIFLFVYDLRSCSFGSRTSSVITINSKHDSNILRKSSQCCKVKQFIFFSSPGSHVCYETLASVFEF